jgi:hypothetical protein
MDSGPRILETAVYETIKTSYHRSAILSGKMGEKNESMLNYMMARS